MLSSKGENKIIHTAAMLYESVKPWSWKKHLQRYNSLETVELLLKHNGIELDSKSFRVDSFCGFLFIDELGSSIVVNENHIPSRKLFTIAHELGHFYLHKEIQSEFFEKGLKEEVYSYSEKIMERQANLFASELLIPIEVLKHMLSLRFSFVRISKTIGVSIEALKWRIHRYLQVDFNINYKFALLLTNEYIQRSFDGNYEESCIFVMSHNKYIQLEIYQELIGNESFIENYRVNLEPIF
ncbi:ImmA/IrrE family metallo-endopeptidase [Cytobacillus praedii]|uniref:ImmA/IrrE family metallo-endopeptidase n=1 Tax=Cytobacillus praedii TaxID=1742358 RepID=UPI002E1F7B42|nr:ImmA/IrrE family metallo-endopeptidase [Cytobacillus praedii]